MAVTIEKNIRNYKPFGDPVMIPVASGETIYHGTLACVYKGYLYNLDSTAVPGARVCAIVADDTASDDGTPAATTANGSISGSFQETSVVAGDKTVRKCYLHGEVELTFTAIAQTDLFKTVYASDNYTCDETQIAGARIGSLTKYISATVGCVNLNTYYNADGTIVYRGSITAATTTTGGDAISWANPTGETIMVEDFVGDVTTQATGAATLNVGIAADGTTSSDTLIDTVDVGSAAIVFSATNDGGTNGQSYRKCTSTQYVTATPSATLAGLVGTYAIYYRIWE